MHILQQSLKIWKLRKTPLQQPRQRLNSCGLTCKEQEKIRLHWCCGPHTLRIPHAALLAASHQPQLGQLHFVQPRRRRGCASRRPKKWLTSYRYNSKLAAFGHLIDFQARWLSPWSGSQYSSVSPWTKTTRTGDGRRTSTSLPSLYLLTAWSGEIVANMEQEKAENQTFSESWKSSTLMQTRPWGRKKSKLWVRLLRSWLLKRHEMPGQGPTTSFRIHRERSTRTVMMKEPATTAHTNAHV